MFPQNNALQTHLAVFALDRQTGTPIYRVPFYAEVGYILTPPSFRGPDNAIENFVNGIFNHEEDQDQTLRLVNAYGDSLAQQVSAAYLVTLEHAEVQDLLGKIYEIIYSEHSEVIDQPKTVDDETLRQIFAQATQRIVDDMGLPPNLSPTNQRRTVPLGMLATDHAGYLSFDLTQLPAELRIDFRNPMTAQLHADDGRVAGLSIWLYPWGRESERIDALAQGRISTRAVVVKLEIDRVHLMPNMRMLALASMQNPSLTDWYLSPSSFSANPQTLLGEAGCENLFPANTAIQEFISYQVVRLADVDDMKIAVPKGAYKVGMANEFKTSWFSLGHSLGQILYSTPLAPGESVNLAVIDWVRKDQTVRQEDTKLNESLTHDQYRDRTITETVSAAMDEMQRGSSFMGGAALSYGATSVKDNVATALGFAGSLGGSTAKSSGHRELAGTTTQRLNEHISQASSALRELQSTVVIEASQQEHETIKTRTIVNYNHSHALTILYYEVLRHFRVVTRLVRQRPVLFIPLNASSLEVPEKDGFIKETKIATKLAKALRKELVIAHILQYRAILEKYLLEDRFADHFEALARADYREKLAAIKKESNGIEDEKPQPVWEGEREFNLFMFEMRTGGIVSEGPEFVQIRATLVGTVGTQNVELLNGNNTEVLNPPGSFREKNHTVKFTAMSGRKKEEPGEPVPEVAWKDIKMVSIGIAPMNGPASDISFESIKIIARDLKGQEIDLVWMDYNKGHEFINGATSILLPSRRPTPKPSEPAPPKLSPEEIEDEVKIQALLEHIKSHSAFYARAILLEGDRYQQSVHLQAKGLIDHVENRPLEIIGTWVAYPCTDPDWVKEIEAAIAKDERSIEQGEQLITLPTRGVFGEAKLGHCNASEEIDNNRFWDWQTSPIPHMAPEIAPVTPVTPQVTQQNAQPTNFPAAMVNIVNPPAAPDPTGLTAVLNALSTPNIFRDMSGRAEVASLLQKLSDNTIGIAEAANAARGLQLKYGADMQGGQGSSSATGGSENKATAPKQPTPREAHDAIKLSENEMNKGTITPEDHSENVKKQLDQVVTPPTPKKAPKKASVAKPKMRLVTFAFSYSTNHVMFGKWEIDLISNGYNLHTEKKMINTEEKVSGVEIGNKIEIYVEEKFGDKDNVQVLIRGSIVGLPQSLIAEKSTYAFSTWTDTDKLGHFTQVIKGEDFMKAHTIQVIQPTEPIEFVIERSVQDSTAQTKIFGTKGEAEFGWGTESEGGANIGIGEVKGTVKINAKGLIGVHSENQTVEGAGNAYTEKVSFKGQILSASGPTIKPIL